MNTNAQLYVDAAVENESPFVAVKIFLHSAVKSKGVSGSSHCYRDLSCDIHVGHCPTQKKILTCPKANILVKSQKKKVAVSA